MKNNFLWIFIAGPLLLIFSCESDNIEEKYFADQGIEAPGDTSIQNKYSEILWLPLNGNLNDTTGNNTPLVMVGNIMFVEGINSEHGKGLQFDGSSYLLINLGYFDTLSAVMWIKGTGELETSNSPILFDYGQNSLALKLDATSGATSITVKKNADSFNSIETSSVEYLNSFNRYSFVYIEAGGATTRVYFKGYTSNGEEIIYKNDNSSPGIIEAESDILYIGRSSLRENQSAGFFKGAIDEIHIYNKPLSSSEIEKMALIPTR